MISGNQLKATLFSAEQPRYPIKDRRYWLTWWNANSQFCYSDNELVLLKRIEAEFNCLQERNHADYFKLQENKQWLDWWQCATPDKTLTPHQTDSFTLPTREAKDSKAYPLWNYADNMARQIANWLSERIKKQDPNLMNDPVGLVFAELRDWFYTDLSEKECKKEVLDQLAKRQSYLKNLIHIIPNFGPDRLRLHEIQHSLDEATRVVRDCIANKELPQLLSDTIISGKSLETTLGTYLHFLLVDEEVADNFSADYLEGNRRNCQLSPVCKIYQTIQESQDRHTITTDLAKYQAVNRFYDMSKLSTANNPNLIQLTLKENLGNVVKFASFVTAQDKKNYLEALAALEALINIRKTLEKFNHVQSRIGTYVFAFNYLEKASALGSHYINLITKTKLLVKGLIISADNGLNGILSSPENRKYNKKFEKNLRSLETRVAKGTTVSTQLDTFCHHAIESMNKYQQEMKKLVTSLESGEASHELEIAMHDLYEQMNYLNTVLPALLDESAVKIIHPTEAPLTTCVPAMNTIDTCAITAEPSSHIEATTIEEIPSSNAKDIPPFHFDSVRWDVKTTLENVAPIFVLHLYQIGRIVGSLEFSSELSDIKKHPNTHEPIYVYRFYDGSNEIGSAELYGQPSFCVSANRQEHNIIKTTGIFNQFTVTQEKLTLANSVCHVLPPSFWNKMLMEVETSAAHGFLRGGANAISSKVTASSKAQYILSQLTYLGCVFTWKFGHYYAQIDEEEKSVASVNAMYKAAWQAAYDTGQVALINAGLTAVNSVFQKIGVMLENNQWKKTGAAVKKASNYLRYGFFAYNVVGNHLTNPKQLAEAAALGTAAIITGTATEIVTEKVARGLLNSMPTIM